MYEGAGAPRAILAVIASGGQLARRSALRLAMGGADVVLVGPADEAAVSTIDDITETGRTGILVDDADAARAAIGGVFGRHDVDLIVTTDDAWVPTSLSDLLAPDGATVTGSTVDDIVVAVLDR